MTRFQKGRQKTGGRKKGTPNKIAAEFWDALLEDFRANKMEALRILRIERPADYAKLVSEIAAKQQLPGMAEPDVGTIARIKRVIIDPKMNDSTVVPDPLDRNAIAPPSDEPQKLLEHKKSGPTQDPDPETGKI
jgi:hypothetical protein